MKYSSEERTSTDSNWNNYFYHSRREFGDCWCVSNDWFELEIVGEWLLVCFYTPPTMIVRLWKMKSIRQPKGQVWLELPHFTYVGNETGGDSIYDPLLFVSRMRSKYKRRTIGRISASECIPFHPSVSVYAPPKHHQILYAKIRTEGWQ